MAALDRELPLQDMAGALEDLSPRRRYSLQMVLIRNQPEMQVETMPPSPSMKATMMMMSSDPLREIRVKT